MLSLKLWYTAVSFRLTSNGVLATSVVVLAAAAAIVPPTSRYRVITSEPGWFNVAATVRFGSPFDGITALSTVAPGAITPITGPVAFEVLVQ